MKKILLTGDKGYIGSVLAPKLLKKGYQIKGIDIGIAQDALKTQFTYESLIKDIRKIDKEDLRDIDAVIHLSGLSNDPMGEVNPKLTLDINYKSTINLARLAKKTGVRRFIFSSSCSIYGIAKNGVVDEKSPVNPLTAYAKSKILSEKRLKELSSPSFCVGIMRNATVYGFSPKFRSDLVVNNLICSGLALDKIKILSDGSPWRPLIDVRDLADIFIMFLEVDHKKINGKIINVGFNENNFTVKQIVEKIHNAIPDAEIVFTGEHGKDSRSYRVRFDILKEIFPNLSQKWILERSIKDMIANLRKIGFSKTDFEGGKFARLIQLKDFSNTRGFKEYLQ